MIGIAEVERRHLAHRLANARFLSLISDGTTDSSISEAEIVFVRYSIGGIVATSFVGVENVAKADAPSSVPSIGWSKSFRKQHF